MNRILTRINYVSDIFYFKFNNTDVTDVIYNYVIQFRLVTYTVKDMCYFVYDM